MQPPRKIFIHIHIPKTGGTSVRDFLHRNFGRKCGNTAGILNNYLYTKQQVTDILEEQPQIQCLSGHKLSLNIPFEREDMDITALTWVRDPVEQFISTYFYFRNNKGLHIDPTAKTLTLEQYAQKAVDEAKEGRNLNLQLQILAEGDLDLVKKRIQENRLLLFPTQKMKASFETLAIRFPEFFVDCRVNKKNVSKKDQLVDPNIREQLLPLMQEDLKLFNIAKSFEFDPAAETNNTNPSLRLKVTKGAAKILGKSATCLNSIANSLMAIK